MANLPSFISRYRQEIRQLRGEQSNEPRQLFEPSSQGSRLQGISIHSTRPQEVLVEFGIARVRTYSRLQILARKDPEKDPWELVLGDRVIDEEITPPTNWSVGETVTLSRGVAPENRGDFKIIEVKGCTLFFAPCKEIRPAMVSQAVPLILWEPLWSLKVPKEAGMNGNPCVDALDHRVLPMVDPKDPHLILEDPLWARLPENTQGSSGHVTIHVWGGDY